VEGRACGGGGGLKMKIFICTILLCFCSSTTAIAKYKKPEPVYIERPPINRPAVMSTADKNRLYKMNNQPIEISKETQEYLKTLEAEKEK
jgi:hypothetical protein